MKTPLLGALFLMVSNTALALTIDVAELRNTKGKVMCYLYTSEKGFPDDPSKAKMNVVSAIAPGGTATCEFNSPELQLPEIAISVLHDEDENGAMKMNFIGIPREGWAASNNAEAQTFGPPTYQDAKFDPRKVTQQTLKIRY